MRFVLLGLLLTPMALANDHNNLDHGRPLRFDDAYSIAYGEREFEFGLGSHPSAASSLSYGFAKNQDLTIGFDAERGANTVGEFSYFRNISREIGDAPAFGFRVTANTVAKQRTSADLRLIATKAWHQYDKVHLNIDFNTIQSPGLIIGYSAPLAYPRSFDQTMLAEVGYQNRETIFGIGLRRQISAQSVLDFGVRSGKQTTLVFGYSIGF